MSSRCLCVSVVVTLTKPERLSGVEEVGPGIAFFLQQLRHIRDGEVGDLHALRDLLPRQRHRYRGLRFCACREDRSQTFPPRVLHPVDINLRRGALRNRSFDSRDLWCALRDFSRKQSRKLRRLIVFVLWFQRSEEHTSELQSPY